MDAGRELDALIAENVMGINLMTLKNSSWMPLYRTSNWEQCPTSILPKYSTDISAAWEVVEKVKSLSKYSSHFLIQTDTIFYDDDNPNGHWAWFRKDNADNDVEYSDWGTTAPHAICLAALKVIGVEI